MSKKGDPRVQAKWKALRRRILDADDTCHICHHPGADTVDHLTPLAAGGDALDPDNLAPAHRICNSRKNTKQAGFFSGPTTTDRPGEERALDACRTNTKAVRRVSPWLNDDERDDSEVDGA